MKKVWMVFVMIAVICIEGCGSNNNVNQTKDAGKEEKEQNQDKEEGQETEEQTYYLTKEIESKALEGNLGGISTQQSIYVCLPPSYYDSQKKYPVVYYLPGFGEDVSKFIVGNMKKLDEAFAQYGKEFILIGVNGRNNDGGTFFVDSPVNGDWEEYVTKEVVAVVDKNFRTIKDMNARGICGFSMGGFGAINLSLRNPDIFGSVFAMSPGLLADGELSIAMESWEGDNSFLKAYAQAFSPNVKNEETYGTIPEFSGTIEDNQVIKDWENGFGNLNQKISDYVALKQPLNGIKIVYGEKDSYEWIPSGCKFFSQCLTQQGVEHSIEEFAGGHNIPPNVIEEYLLPFFGQELIYE